jgi:hypothetical protein
MHINERSRAHLRYREACSVDALMLAEDASRGASGTRRSARHAKRPTTSSVREREHATYAKRAWAVLSIRKEHFLRKESLNAIAHAKKMATVRRPSSR